MALITCPECSNTVSSKASSCPKCGAPIESAKDVRGAGVQLATTQLTSKRIKMIRLIGMVMLGSGIAMSLSIPDYSGLFWPGVGAMGLLVMGYASIKQWWHHS